MATLYRDWSEYALGDTIGVEITDIVATQESGAEYETKQIVARASGPAGRALETYKFGTTPRQLFLAFTDAGITGAASGEIYCEIESPAADKRMFESGPCSHIPVDGVTRSGITAQGRGAGGSSVIPCIRKVVSGTVSNSSNGITFTANTDVYCQLYRFTTVGADLTLQYKWWRRDSESEPVSWGLTWTANEFVGAEGRLGFARLSSDTQYLLFIGIGTGADPAPRAAAGGTNATLALTDAPDSLALTTSIPATAALALTDSADALALTVDTPAPPVTEFLSDAFSEATNTPLASHVPETGGTWVQHAFSGGKTATAAGGRGGVYGEATDASSYYYNDASPPSADYSITAFCQHLLTNDSAAIVGVMGRLQTGTNTGYQFQLGATNFELHRIVGGVSTLLLTGPVVAQYTGYTIKLEMVGSVISAMVDGTHITGSPYTDPSPIVGTGKAGLVARFAGRVISMSAISAAAPGATLALTDAPDSLDLTVSLPATAPLALTDAPDALALAVEVPTSAILALTDAPDSLALTASITTVAALALTDTPDSLALTTSIGVSHDIRLTLGIYAEQGGALSQTGMRYVVLAADLASVVASGSALDTGAGGVVSIDINGSPYVVGDYVPVLITEYNDITAPPDRTVRSMFGFVPATAQP